MLQFIAVVAWYAVKSKEQELKLDLLKVTWLQWVAFFALVFLGQVIAAYLPVGIFMTGRRTTPHLAQCLAQNLAILSCDRHGSLRSHEA